MKKTSRTRTSIAIWPSKVKEAKRLVEHPRIRDVFPGMGVPTLKKVHELAHELGLDEIDRRLRK